MAAAIQVPKLKIEFESPEAYIPGENKSKLLKKGGQLYRWIMSIREQLTAAGIPFDGRVPHIELLSPNEAKTSDKTERSGMIHLRALYLQADSDLGGCHPKVEQMGSNALVVNTGTIPAYADGTPSDKLRYTHATIAWFSQGISDRLFRSCQAFAAKATAEVVAEN